jgi:glycosyltransferase involved in cell wall biosynthesis
VRIGIDVYQAAFRYGGIPRYVRALVPALSAAAPSDQFILASNHFRAPELRWRPGGANVTHVQLRVPRRLMQTCWDRLGWPPVESFIGAVDIFHGTHFILPPVRAAKRVLTVHDVTFLRHPEYFSDQVMNERWHRQELLVALGRADAVIADSRNTMDDLVEILGYPKERIRVIPLGVEPNFFVDSEASMPAVKNRYGLDRPYLVFLVGTPEPRKNLQRTVAAARLAAPDLPLAVIGPPESIRTILGSESRGVILPGLVPDADLPLILHGAELALYPSLYEGFGLPALEALAAGVPLITSDRSSLPEIVGNAAVLVNPESVEEIAEAIRVLLADSDRRKRLVELGRIRARELSWDRTAAQVLHLYRALSDRSG